MLHLPGPAVQAGREQLWPCVLVSKQPTSIGVWAGSRWPASRAYTCSDPSPSLDLVTASRLHIVPGLTPPCLLHAPRLQLLVLPPGNEPLHALQLPRVPRQVWAPASGEPLGGVGRAASDEAFQRRGRCGGLGDITRASPLCSRAMSLSPPNTVQPPSTTTRSVPSCTTSWQPSSLRSMRHGGRRRRVSAAWLPGCLAAMQGWAGWMHGGCIAGRSVPCAAIHCPRFWL